MISKELREARWRFFVMTALVLLSVPFTTPLETTAREALADGVDVAVFELYEMFALGGVPLALLAALLGAGSVSSEAERGSILLLLSKPVGRTRVLLTKYAVCAGVLLLAAIIGHVLLLAIAAKSYPLAALSGVGSILATVLLWSGSLFVLGVAMTFSILLKKTLAALTATLFGLYLLFFQAPFLLVGLLPRNVRNRQIYDPGAPAFEQPVLSGILEEKLMLTSYWTNNGLYSGESLARADLSVCLLAASARTVDIQT